MNGQPLAELRVIELGGGVGGGYATKLFADFGAEVIKVEPPEGDETRRQGPFTGEVDLEQGALHLHLDTNKRSIVVDLSTAAGRERVKGLVAGADAVVETFAPGVLESHGLGFDTLSAIQPKLVMTSITPFGQDGPYAGYKGTDIVYYAMGGPMNSTGLEEREPLKLGGQMITYQGGNVAASATLAALATVALPGKSAIHVDVSAVEAQEGSIDRRLAFLVAYGYHGAVQPREGTQRLSPAPMGIYPARDGYVQVVTIPAWVSRMLATLEDPGLAELYADPGWMINPDVPGATDEVLFPWLLERSREEAMAAAQAHGWPITAVHDAAEVMADPHFADRGFFPEVEHPVAGRYRALGGPFRLEGAWELRRPAPLLGEADAGEDTLVDRAAPGPGLSPVGSLPAPDLPMEGVRVLDLTVVWAGPYATMLLADLGAEVIRLDNPQLFPSSTRGFAPRLTTDVAKMVGPLGGGYPDWEPGERPWNRAAMFNCHARGKRQATLDIRSPLGKETFLRLVEKADLIVENNAVKLLEQLDLPWEAISARNPRISLLRMPPMGLSGPYHRHVGFGAHFEALSGLTSLRGYPGADLTSTTSVFHMDPASGVTGVFAALLALQRRAKTGKGSLVEFDQAENMMQHIGELLIDAGRTGRTHPPIGNRSETRAPQGCYRCEGADRWAVISVGDDEEWRGLTLAMGSPEWAASHRFASASGRHEHHDELDERIGEWTATLTPAEVFHRCQAQGVPAGPVLTEADAFVDPHLRARGFFRTNHGVESGDHEYPRHLWQWSGPPMAWDAISAMGADNEYVYKTMLGLDDAEYADLVAGGHISRDYLGPDGKPL